MPLLGYVPKTIHYTTGYALGIWICGYSLFCKRELWASKSASAHSTKSLKISGCKGWCPKDLRVRAPAAPAAPALTHSLLHWQTNITLLLVFFCILIWIKTFSLIEKTQKVHKQTVHCAEWDKFFGSYIWEYICMTNASVLSGKKLHLAICFNPLRADRCQQIKQNWIWRRSSSELKNWSSGPVEKLVARQAAVRHIELRVSQFVHKGPFNDYLETI